MNDKEKLKRILLRMYLLAKKGKFEKVKELNKKAIALQKKNFDTKGALTKEEEPFDKARNNILYFTGNFNEEEKKIFLNDALKYLNQIKTK